MRRIAAWTMILSPFALAMILAVYPPAFELSRLFEGLVATLILNGIGWFLK